MKRADRFESMSELTPAPASRSDSPGDRSVPLFPGPTPQAIPSRTRLRVLWKHLAAPSWGRSFRDRDAQLIQYHEIPHSPYHSYIAADPVRLDLDRDGVPILVELDFSGGQFEVDGCLRPPLDFDLGAVRLLDFPSRIRPYALTTDESNSLFHMVLSGHPPILALQSGRGVIWEVDADSCLSGLWLIKCQDDPYGRGRRRWRSRTWRLARRRALLEGGASRLSPISVETEPEA